MNNNRIRANKLSFISHFAICNFIYTNVKVCNELVIHLYYTHKYSLDIMILIQKKELSHDLLNNFGDKPFK